MNCPFDKEKLSGYYDGELDAAEKAEVERHIASCSECLRELGELKSAAILVKELPRLRAPRSIAEGVAREMRTAGKVHSFARMRRTILWASAAAAALFVGLNIVYFSTADRTASAPAMAKAPAPVTVVGKIQQAEQPREELQKNAAPGKEAGVERRAAADRAAADEGKLRENRKQVDEQKKEDLATKPDAVKKVEAMPVERARDKAGDGLAKGAAEPAAPPKPAAAPPGASAPAPAPVAKPAPEAAEKAATKKDLAENLTRAESELKNKRGAAEPAVAAEAPPTHLTLASTQLSKSRPQVEEALRKMGVALPPPAPPPAKMMKAPAARETDTTIALELTDAQIARLRQELDKPGSSRLLAAAPGDPMLAEFRDGRMFGRKETAGAATGGGAQAGKSRELGKADPKPEPKPEPKTEAPKDAKESKDFDAAPADKAPEARRRVILHLIEVPYVPDTQPAPDALKK